MAEIIALVRVGQLIAGSLIGLACIYFGYRLFAQIPVNVTNDGQFNMPKIGEAKLKVAPGIFFAFLGTAIVYFSLDRPITLERTDGANKTFSYSRSSKTKESKSGGLQEMCGPGSGRPCPVDTGSK